MTQLKRTAQVLLVLWVLYPVFSHAEPVLHEDIEDYFGARWFEIELIVFERLNVLELNTAEQLVGEWPRSWPKQLRMLTPVVDIEAPSESVDFMRDSLLCLGYPLLPQQDLRPPGVIPLKRLLESEPAAPLPFNVPAPEAPPVLPTQTPVTEEFLSDETTDETPPDTFEAEPNPVGLFAGEFQKFEQSLYSSSYSPLEALALEGHVKAINRQSTLRPLTHVRWRQPVPERGQGQPVMLANAPGPNAPLSSTGLPRLTGHVDVTLGRYLHFATNLWYQSDSAGLDIETFPVSLERLPIDAARGFMRLVESRRMRSEELHYLDHPKLGVVVLIEPVRVPDGLLAQHQALLDSADEAAQ